MTDTRWNVAEESSALIIVDMQNGFLRSDGFFAKGGLDLSRPIASLALTAAIVILILFLPQRAGGHPGAEPVRS